MSEPQSPTFCAQCGRKLSPEDRFCPECGTRVPEKSAATPPKSPAGVPPTVVLPPDQPPAGVPPTVVLPPTQPPAGVPPTVVLPPDQPPAGVPTVVLPPNQPPAGVPPTVVLPPTQPPAGSPPPHSPPGVPPVIPPVQSVGTPPDPFLPPSPPAYSGSSTHPNPFHIPSTTGMTAKSTNNWLVWGLVGGGGCLLLLFMVACILVFISIFSTLDTASNNPVPTSATTGGGGAVAPVTSGQVLFRDDFEDPQASDLGEREDRSSRYAYEQGGYVIEVKKSETLAWALVEGTYRDVVIETSYSIPQNSAEVAAGLIFHYQDSNNFYLFSVSNDGYYALELLKDDQWVTLIDWTKHNVINAAKNRIRVVLNRDEITLFVNDRQLEKTRDPTFTSGEIGLAVTSFDKAGAIVRYDEITIRRR